MKRVARRYVVFLVVFCLTVFIFWAYGANIFAILLKQARAYTPPQFLTWLSLASSLAVAVAFCVMPFILFRIVRKRSDVPFGWVVLCVAGFLFLTGVTTFFGLLNLWFHGPIAIWTLVLTQVGTALLAFATLLILNALLPRILEIPTRAQWLALHTDFVRAEARAEEKDKLLAAVSHELRTPLAPLLASLTELEQRTAAATDPEIKNCFAVMRVNLQREVALVNDLIDRLEIPGATSQPSIASSLPAPSGEFRPRRLLILEDHLDTLRVFARMLRREGFEVHETSTVAEAVSAARPGDFLISDIALPDGDGCEVMRRLSGLGITGIAISGFGTARDRERYRSAGFAEFFVKPVDVNQVVNAIGRILAQGKAVLSG